jgi:hypothetical protein
LKSLRSERRGNKQIPKFFKVPGVLDSEALNSTNARLDYWLGVCWPRKQNPNII